MNNADQRRELPRWRRYVNGLFSAEISAITRYYDRLIQVAPRPGDTGYLLSTIDCPRKESVAALEDFPSLRDEADARTAVLINGNFNDDHDIQGTLEQLRAKLARTSRVCVVAYNPYLRVLYSLANRLRVRKGPLPETFVTRTDFENIAALAGFELVRYRFVGYSPLSLFGLGTLLNRLLPAVPVLRWLHLAALVVLRPRIPSAHKPSLSIVIPCRNERGNIEPAIRRLPRMEGTTVEVIFVEGHSSDGTWEEVQRVVAAYAPSVSMKAARQAGKGKNDAVRLGFSLATGELLTILDADLTMPPELLPRFYEAWRQGLADFVNGSRLVYPMEGEAMRFLNRLGNVFFAKALSRVLGTKLGDSLCGTKLFARHDYRRICRWRDDFGDFDPFGDYELLFPAAGIALGIIDVPIRYRARSYGSTNISRFSHGLLLLRMTFFGFLHVCLGRRSRAASTPCRVAASMSGAGDVRGRRRAAGLAAAADDPDAVQVTEAHRGYIRRKSFLRRIYLEHYRFFASEIAPLPAGIAVELGSGGGFLREVVPEALTTDVVPLSTVQAVVSAMELPFGDRSVRAILMINVLHHVQDPGRFFAEASRCLVPGGKVVMVEPANTPFSRFVYTHFHHEPFDPEMPGWKLPAGGRLSGANDALPGIIFERDRELFRSRFPELSVERFEHIMPISYIVSGGVNPWALLPGAAFPVVRAVERALGPLNARLGLFTRIVIRHSAGARLARPGAC